MEEQTTVLGAPGTGKTYTLVQEILVGLIARGLSPSDICFTSFTRAAANEAKARAIAALGGGDRDYEWFGTIHSLCGKLLDIDWSHRLLADNNDVGRTLLRQFGEEQGIQFDFQHTDWDEEADFGVTNPKVEGNQLLSWWAHVRNRKVDLDTALATWKMPSSLFTPARLRTLVEAYERFKNDMYRVDFTDVLIQADMRGVRPQTSVLILDEAQDLAPLEWSILDHWRDSAETVYLAGDDPQAIYAWKGAEARLFLDRIAEGSVRTLEQSYRLPRSGWAVSEWLLNRIEERYPKQFRSREEDGEVQERTLSRVPFEHNGSWFVLARNTYLLAAARNELEDRGLPYRSKRGFDPYGAYWMAGRAITKLAHNARIDHDELRALLRRLVEGEHYNASLAYQLRTNRTANIPAMVERSQLEALGFTEQFTERLDSDPVPVRGLALSGRNRNYLARLQRADADVFDKEPAITLSTIHGVKGNEAEHVALLTDFSPASRETMDSDPDSEHRVFYVGATRARRNLYIVSPQTPIAYQPLADGWWHEALQPKVGSRDL